MTKLIIFDMDGTLIDTDQVLIGTWTEMFDKFIPGVPYDDELFRSFSGPSLSDTINRFFSNCDYSIDYITKEYNLRTGKYYDMYAKLFENEIENLDKIKAMGFKFAIVTNKIRERVIYCAKLLGIEKYFDFAVCGDDVINTKPDPEGIYKCLDHFGVTPEETLYIGDTEFDYHAAKAANVDCILLQVAPRKYGKDIKPKSILSSYNDLYEELKKYENK